MDLGTNLLLLGALVIAVGGPILWFVGGLLAWPVGAIMCRRGRHNWLTHHSSQLGSYDYCRRCPARREPSRH